MRAPILITAFIASAVFIDHSAVAQAPSSSEGERDKANPSFSLEAGEYLLRLISDDLPKDKRDSTNHAKLTIDSTQKIQKITLVIRRDDPPRTIEFRGIKFGNSIKLSSTGVEHEEVLSMHLVGSLSNNNEAKGKATVLVDDAIGLRGEWTLKRKPEAAPKSK